jgi:predicted CXXCH cytochrome family protein
MNTRRLLTKRVLINGAVVLWGVFLAACVMVERTMFAPPMTVAGAEFVGSSECAQCHAEETEGFHDATHAKLFAEGTHGKEMSCEACHGPASLHIETGGEFGTIVNPGNSPETCFQCHLDKRGEFALTHSHPVMSGKVTCNDCHEPHKGDAIMGGGTNLASANETCLQCHDAQRGPYVFEHEASREGCVTCHQPHGTVNAKMLRTTNQSLCLQCHYQEQTASGQLLIGGRDHRSFVSRGTCWTAGCHEAVHGSHVNSSLRF